MKKIALLATATASLVCQGCASSHTSPSLGMVGPAPIQTTTRHDPDGQLIVYSAEEINADINRRDPYRPEYSDYKIYTSGGKLLQTVHNNSGTILQDALAVKLSPGNYVVKAFSNGHGLVTVPVLIKAQQPTELHLDGSIDSAWKAMSRVPHDTDLVRMPDGQVVGWACTAVD